MPRQGYAMDICPITVGEALHLTEKCLCASVRIKASEFFPTVPVWGGMSYGSRKGLTACMEEHWMEEHLYSFVSGHEECF